MASAVQNQVDESSMALRHKLNKLRRMSWPERFFRLQTLVDRRRERLQHTLGRDVWDEKAFRSSLNLPLIPSYQGPPSNPLLLRGDKGGLIGRESCPCGTTFSAEANLATALLNWSKEKRPVRFFFDPGNAADLVETMKRRFPQIIEESIEEAEAVCQQKIELYETVVQFDGRIPWTSDPITLRPWPMRFYQQVDAFTARDDGVDLRYSDGLNRHQFLIPLAKAYWLTGEAKYAEKCLTLITDWIDANPYKVGVNWTSALEVAFRSISWLWTYHFLLHSEQLTPEIHQKWLISFCQHADFLSRHLSFYFSPYNHLIGEVSGLYMIASLFPMFREAAQWKEKAWQVLCDEVERQFYPDGGTVEQATFYHHATLGFYLLACILRRKNGEANPSHMLARLEKATEYTLQLMRPDGGLPMFGDIDDGRSIRIGRPAFHWDFRAFLSIGAALFNRGDMKRQSGGFHEDALWLLGLDGWEKYQQLETQTPDANAVALPDSGYYVMRSGWDKNAHMLCFDCGEQADGLFTDATPSAAHGHADCLSIDLCVGGYPFLIDPGLNTYNGAPAWRDYFRKTRAHNTVEVDGEDQSEHLGHMDWRYVYTPQLGRWINAPIFDYVSGSHNGYARRGVTHRRSVFFRRSDYWVVCDELLGRGNHEAAGYWHVAPEVEPRVEEDGCHLRHASGQNLLLSVSTKGSPPWQGGVGGACSERSRGGGFPTCPRWTGGEPTPLQSPLSKGGNHWPPEIVAPKEDDPESGWVCPGYGRKAPAAIVRFRQSVKLPVRWYTLLYPFTGERPGAHVQWLEAGLKIRTAHFEDLLLFKEDKHALEETESVSSDAQCVYIRRRSEDGKMLAGGFIDGRRLRVEDLITFEAEKRLDFAVIVNDGTNRTVHLSPGVGYTISEAERDEETRKNPGD